MMKSLSLPLMLLLSSQMSTIPVVGIYNKGITNYVFADGQLYATDTCITISSYMVSYECITSSQLRKHVWYSSYDYSCFYGYTGDTYYDYYGSTDDLEFECSFYDDSAIYFYNYSASYTSLYYDCPRYDYYSYELRSGVTGVCVPGEHGYYQWNCSDYSLFRDWYSDSYCSYYVWSENLACNVSLGSCDSYTTYDSIGYGTTYYYDYNYGEDTGIGVIATILIILGVTIFVIMTICCWCAGGLKHSTSYFKAGSTPTVVHTQPKPVTTTTTVTTVNMTPQTQYAPQVQMQYYPQQQQQYIPQQQYVPQQQYMMQQPQVQPVQPTPYGYMPQPVYSKQPITAYTYNNIQPSAPSQSITTQPSITNQQPTTITPQPTNDYNTITPQYNVYVPNAPFSEPGSDEEGVSNNVTNS